MTTNNSPNLLRHLSIEQRRMSALKVNPRNARTHSKRQVTAIAESIKSFGFTNPVLVDDDDMILAGHGRFQAAKLLGLDAVPTIRISRLSEAQRRAFVLADNKLAERAGWDRELLAVELGELSVMLPDLGLSVDLTGFDAGEVDTILADAEEDKAVSRDDEAVPVPDQPISRLGDLWVLGLHRLLCGDARDPAALRALLANDPADMVFAEPPHNVRIDGHILGRGQHQPVEFAMASGEMSEAEFTAFLQQVLGNAAAESHDGALHFVCTDWRHLGELLTAGKSVYSEMKDLCVWAKTDSGQGSLYRSQHELVAVFKVGDGEYTNNIKSGKFGRSRSNIWRYTGVNSFKAGRQEEFAAHRTAKPVALVCDAIKDVTRRGAIVLDLFGGSGTTLVAAERTGRRARLLEIEPRYVDATIARFEQVTKADAIYAETGQSYAEVAAERRVIT